LKYSYYPGCSLHATGKEYDASTRAALGALGVELQELPDWNCCGASSGHSLNPRAAVTLPARNIAAAQKMNQDLVAPCAACFNRLKAAQHALEAGGEARAEIERTVGFEYTGATQILNPIDLVVNRIGLARVRETVKRPLAGLRVVGYYGCLLVRPADVVQFDDPEHPVLMDRLLAALGAEAADWPYATVCCGGSLSLTRTKIVSKLVDDLVAHARQAGAQAIVTACPLCQTNLEMRQTGADKLPVIYFTELMGLAFGVKASRAWWSMHLISPRDLVEQFQAA
jgi:heterodisulfide reductase subunit B